MAILFKKFFIKHDTLSSDPPHEQSSTDAYIFFSKDNHLSPTFKEQITTPTLIMNHYPRPKTLVQLERSEPHDNEKSTLPNNITYGELLSELDQLKNKRDRVQGDQFNEVCQKIIQYTTEKVLS